MNFISVQKKYLLMKKNNKQLHDGQGKKQKGFKKKFQGLTIVGEKLQLLSAIIYSIICVYTACPPLNLLSYCFKRWYKDLTQFQQPVHVWNLVIKGVI